ncbi:hypothetical protein AB6F62_16685 [Providencia huaxiensis]|uniref:baseplate complex protein n=1 Tax=Providencia huaxiensis TaxID=2027290 RepID=UPI0034DCDD77
MKTLHKTDGFIRKSVVIWSLRGKGTGDYLAERLQKDIPEPDAIFTLATLFAGSELAPLKGMLHDPTKSTNSTEPDDNTSSDGEAIPLKNIKVNSSIQFQDKDQSGQTSSTSVAEQGIKPQELVYNGRD